MDGGCTKDTNIPTRAKSKIIQHITRSFPFLRNFDSLYLSIRHYLLLFFLFLSTRSTNSPSPFQSKSIQFLYTAEPRIAQRSRQYFAPPFVRVAGSGLFNIKELTAPEAVDNASHYRSCRPGRARQLIPRRTRE